jgi:hypothetical protein
MSSAVPLTQAVTNGDVDAVNAALAAGADVNERNNGGQTALILAVIFNHTNLVHLLVKAGANPRLRDNLGLDAIEWAQRRGLTDVVNLFTNRVVETRIDTNSDEKSRKWLEGVKKRIQEQQARTQPVVEESVFPEPEPEPAPEPEQEPPSPARKRCPKCGAIYNSELVAYCAHHVVRLVEIDAGADEPLLFSATTSTSTTNTPLLWIFVLLTISGAAFAGYFITSQLTGPVAPDSQTTTAPQQPRGYLKGSPVAGGDLASRSIKLPEAECPVFDNDSRPAGAAKTVNVRIKLDKNGKVYWARAEGGDEAMRTAATEAATNSIFSPEKLRGRETEGTITYTFTP